VVISADVTVGFATYLIECEWMAELILDEKAKTSKFTAV
jgi:hypothetical protein